MRSDESLRWRIDIDAIERINAILRDRVLLTREAPTCVSRAWSRLQTKTREKRTLSAGVRLVTPADNPIAAGAWQLLMASLALMS